MDAEIVIQASSDEHIESLREAVAAVAAERRFLLTVEGFSREETKAFLRGLRRGGGVHLVALAGSRVVGWCDVARSRWPGTQHVGVLGIGVVGEHRGRGIGSRLLEATLEAAKVAGIERVELEVFSSNERAQRLYERHGFEVEGRKRRARILDGVETDFVMMAKLL